MSHQQNIAIAQKLLEGIGGGQDPAKIAALFDADLIFEIQGDDGVLPWIGRRIGRQAIADFIRDIRTLTEPVTFDVEDILASDSRAAIIGALQTRIKATDKITDAVRDHSDDHRRCRDALSDVGGQLRRLEGGPHLNMAFASCVSAKNIPLGVGYCCSRSSLQ